VPSEYNIKGVTDELTYSLIHIEKPDKRYNHVRPQEKSFDSQGAANRFSHIPYSCGNVIHQNAIKTSYNATIIN
jgi:hypothetical protein